jgi:hypothetical protein
MKIRIGDLQTQRFVMKKLLLNYANHAFRKSQRLNSKTAKEIGNFDRVLSFSPRNIDRGFYQANRHILDQEKGNGYWLWKPYFIQRALDNVKVGDFVFYSDSGSYFIGSIDLAIDVCISSGQDILPFELPYLEKSYTKRDAFILLDCDRPEYYDTKQRQSGFILIKKSNLAMDFFYNLCQVCQDERILTDMENRMGFPNYDEFIAHRHDQSVFSLLTKKYRLDAFRDPTQWGNDAIDHYPNSPYPQIIVSTRARDVAGWKKIVRILRKINNRIHAQFHSSNLFSMRNSISTWMQFHQEP